MANTTSGTVTFDKTFAVDEIMEEAYERIGLQSVSGYQLKTARQITLLSAGNDSSKTFTVVGTDVNGDALSETVTGADSSTATSTGYFATISSITAVGNPAGNMSAGINSEVAGVVFKGRTRVKNLNWTGGGAIGTINVRNSGTAGTSLIAVRSNATLGVNDNLNLADDGVVFASGAYITYTETQCNSVTAFYG